MGEGYKKNMNNDEKIKSVIFETIDELKSIMDVSPKGAAKDLVKKAMGRSVRTKDPLFWPSGLLMLGLTEAIDWAEGRGEQAVKDKILEALSAHIDLWIKKYHKRIQFVDDALAGYSFVRLYLITGDNKYKEAADRIAEYLDRAGKDLERTVIYNPGKNSANIFADGVGQVSMFYAAYAHINGGREDSGYIGDAVWQLKKFAQYGMDMRSGLNYHGYELKSQTYRGKASLVCEKKGILGWSRAFGWLMLGLSETVIRLGDTVSTEDEQFLKQWYTELCRLALSYQKKDGSFSWQLPAVAGHVDTSATGMITYAIKKGHKAGLIDDENLEEQLRLADEAMLHYSTGGKITHALSSCDDFAVHYQTYGSYPWGQGAVLSALVSD